MPTDNYYLFEDGEDISHREAARAAKRFRALRQVGSCLLTTLLVGMCFDSGAAAHTRSRAAVLQQIQVSDTAPNPPTQLTSATKSGSSLGLTSALSSGQGITLAIHLSRRVVPKFSRLTAPDRLILDMPQTEPAQNQQVLNVGRRGVRQVRVNLYRNHPSATRVVVETDAPMDFTWTFAGTQLALALRSRVSPGLASAATPPIAPPIAPPTAGLTTASLQAGIPADGSTLTAGSDTAVLQLGSGGEVRVCPGTKIAVTPGKNGSLTFGMSTGAMEVHYHVGASSDFLLTPDFRFQLTGPGDFHVAFSTDRQGTTCVRALNGNNATIAVSELMTDASYIVRPREQIVFRNGSLAKVAFEAPPGCGCPAPVSPTLSASGTPQGGVLLLGDAPTSILTSPDKNHLPVDAPLVFRGDHPNPESGVSPEVAALPLIARVAPSGWERVALAEPELTSAEGERASPNAATQPAHADHASFLQRVKRYFSTWLK